MNDEELGRLLHNVVQLIRFENLIIKELNDNNIREGIIQMIYTNIRGIRNVHDLNNDSLTINSSGFEDLRELLNESKGSLSRELCRNITPQHKNQNFQFLYDTINSPREEGKVVSYIVKRKNMKLELIDYNDPFEENPLTTPLIIVDCNKFMKS